MSVQGWGWNLDSVATVAAWVYTLLTLILVILAIYAYRTASRQLREVERSRQTELLFRIWEKYENDKFYKATRMLSGAGTQFSSLEEFKRAFSNEEELEKAHLARREIKLTLAPLGYLLRFRLIEPEQLFPILPSAIGLWGAGLQKVEHDLREDLQRKRGATIGYKDEVIELVDHLFEKYELHLQECAVMRQIPPP